MIRLESVTKVFADGQVAVDSLDLDIPEGELCVLVGPSGSGKTTTMKMVNRLIEPTSGRIWLGDEDVTHADPVQLRRRIGYVIQQVGLFPHQTVADNVATVPKMLGWDKRRSRARVDELLTLVGLEPGRFARRYPHQLSGGQRQRVGVARALAADPPVLLMDEPFGAIDPITRTRLQDEFLRLQAEVRKTIVFVTHDVDEAVRMGDRIAILKEGGVLAQYATPTEILSNPASDFVASFVGADRGLKRLAVTPIDLAVLEHPPVVRLDDDAVDALRVVDASGSEFAVVVDERGAVDGLVDRKDLTGATSVADRLKPLPTVSATATLRDALSVLLQDDRGVAAVIDGDRYCGVLTPPSVHGALRGAG
jgi:osmoprotectant transport system ATP-binding protein